MGSARGLPSGAFDLTGDGRKELANALQFYDPAQERLVALETSLTLGEAMMAGVGCCSLPDGGRVLAVPCGGDDIVNDTVAFYGTDGVELGRSQLAGPMLPGLWTLEADGVSHIVVLLEDRLLICP